MNYIEIRKDLANMYPSQIMNDIFDIAYEKILFQKSIKQSVKFTQQMINNHLAMSFLENQQVITSQQFYDNNINDIKDEIEPEIQTIDNRMTGNVKTIKIEQKQQLQNSIQRTSHNASPQKSIHIKNPEPNKPFQTITQQSTPLDIVEEYHRKQKALLSENLIQSKNQQLLEEQKKQYLQKVRRQYKDFTYDYDGHIILIKNKKKIKFVPKPAKFGKIIQPKIRQQSNNKSKTIQKNQDQSITKPEIFDYVQTPPNIQYEFECQPGVTFIQDGNIKKQNKIHERKYQQLHELINQDETLQVSKREYKIMTKNGNISKETCSLLDKSESNQNDIIFINEQDQTKITKKNNHININNQTIYKQMMEDKNQNNDFNLKNKIDQLPKISKYYNDVDKFNQQIVFNQDKWNQQNRLISQQQNQENKKQSKESLFKKTFRAVSFLNCIQDNYFYDDQQKKTILQNQKLNKNFDNKKNKIAQNSFHFQNQKDRNVNNRIAKSLHQKQNDKFNQVQKKIIEKYEDIFTHR